MTLLAAHRRFEQGGDAYLGIILAPSDLGLSASLSIALLILLVEDFRDVRIPGISSAPFPEYDR